VQIVYLVAATTIGGQISVGVGVLQGVVLLNTFVIRG